MKIGILGSGTVAQAIGSKLVELDHNVLLSTRNPEKLREWLKQTGEKVQVGTASQAAAFGEILFNATAGNATLQVLETAVSENLAGKILIDISNPLDFSKGLPPSLFVSNTDSLGEQIQRAYPNLKVVKTLNTMNATVMVNPQLVSGGDHTIFVCGNDLSAKAKVSEILSIWFGWKDIIDLGDITAARNIEMIVPLWVNLFMKFGTPMFQFKVVR